MKNEEKESEKVNNDSLPILTDEDSAAVVMPEIELPAIPVSKRRREEIKLHNYEKTCWLSPRVKMFCEHYLETKYDAVVAAAMAGFDGDTRKDLSDVARELLSRANVRRYINERAGMYLKKHNVKIDRVINETACIAFFDEADLYDEFGKLIPAHLLPEKVRRGKGQNKLKALELLGKHLGIFSDKVDVKVAGTVEHTVAKVDLEDRVKQIMDEKLSGLLE